MICANDKFKNVCHGDSGGPLALVDPTKKYWTLIGVTSFMVGQFKKCDIERNPGVFAKVTAQLKWIKSNTGQTCPRPT